MYEIKLEKYSGPLEKLLELIEGKELEITTVNLSHVTADFIEYIKTIEETLHPRVLADFIVVASRLMLIKSKVLLPSLELTTEEEKDIHDLEAKLKIYREFKAAGKLLNASFSNLPQSFVKPFLHLSKAIFHPGPALTCALLFNAASRVFQNMEILIPKEERTVKRAVFTIEEKMQELMTRISSRSISGKFTEFTVGRDRGEVIILFLAMLHLVRQHKISISQESQFNDIVIEQINSNG